MIEKWIDVSAHQGHVDWPKVAASGVKGAVIRAGYGDDITQQDTQFAANIKGAIAAGLKVSIYWFSYADSVTDAQKEFAVCRQIIAPYRGEILFVAYDYEYDSAKYYKKIHGAAPSNALINQMANAFLNAAKADGWETVLYTNNDYRKNVFSAATLAAWFIWLADYSGGPDATCTIQQTSSTGNVPGISGSVDMNTLFKDYTVQRTIVDIDTTMDISFARGTFYTVRTTSPKPVQLTFGTDDVVTIVPSPRSGNDQLFTIVPIGQPGQETGIYTAAPGEKPFRRFKFKIK